MRKGLLPSQREIVIYHAKLPPTPKSVALYLATHAIDNPSVRTTDLIRIFANIFPPVDFNTVSAHCRFAGTLPKLYQEFDVRGADKVVFAKQNLRFKHHQSPY